MCPPCAEELKRARLPVESRFRAADDRVADEERQDVVAELALRLRDEHLEPVVEVPQRLGAVAVIDEAVEGRQEHGAVGHGTVDRVRVRLPLALDEPHALGAEAPLVADPLRHGHRNRLSLRPPARGEVPQALPAAAADDGDLAVMLEGQEHQPDHALAPPAVIPLFAFRTVLEVAGEERPALLELAHDVATKRTVRGQELVHPALALGVPRTPEVPDPGANERQVLDRVDERVPLEERALLPQQPVELRAVVARAQPAEEDEVLRALDGLDDVDLEETEPAHGREHVRRGAVESLRPHGDAPCLLGADLHRRTSSSSIERANRSRARSSASSRAPDFRTPSSRWKARTTRRPSFRSDLRSARPTIWSPRRNGST